MTAVILLVLFAALRATAAMAEAVLAAGPDLRRPAPLADDVLASVVRATAHLATAGAVAMIVVVVWRDAGRGWVPLAVAAAVPVGLVLLDLVPRGLAADAPKRRRRVLQPLVCALAVPLAPVLLAERLFALALPGRRSGALTALRRLGGWLAPHPRGAVLDVSEAGLVGRIARFAGHSVREVMVPHVDVTAVPDTATVAEAIALLHRHGHSRLPVFHERQFNVIGLITHRDLLGVADPGTPVTSVMRDPLFVPDTTPLPALLATLQRASRNLAVVVDEYGGAVGLATVEDVVEEIVGEIEDEYDAPRELFRRVSAGVYLVSARAPVSQVNERFGWNLPEGEYETVGGLVLERLARIPRPGETFDAGRVRIEVTRASARAVQEVRVSEGRR